MAAALGLDNYEAVHARAESLGARFDYALGRAVTDLGTFTGWVWPLLERGACGSLRNGVLCLKGGDLAEELALTGRRWKVWNIHGFFPEPFFETKKIVYTPRT